MKSCESITQEQWKTFEEEGYLRLGKVVDDEFIDSLRVRINEIMMGKVELNYDKMLMQLDSFDGKYDYHDPQTKGFKGATLNYRKVQNLELDTLFLEYMRHPLFKEACRLQYGRAKEIASFRAMFMNKPSRRGTFLPWHQDRWHHLSQDPMLTIWTALDPATIENGCVQIIPRSHKFVINPDHPGAFLTDEQVQIHCQESKRVFLEMKAGEAMLLNNYTLHASDINNTEQSRRAFSVCYMDSSTHYTDLDEKNDFSIIFSKNE